MYLNEKFQTSKIINITKISMKQRGLKQTSGFCFLLTIFMNYLRDFLKQGVILVRKIVCN